uniref:Uncharacterized protein n=1 Tax=Pygocentrus nattereri TaxID=42514 RepID=A0AAR2J2P4_PYGNA
IYRNALKCPLVDMLNGQAAAQRLQEGRQRVQHRAQVEEDTPGLVWHPTHQECAHNQHYKHT